MSIEPRRRKAYSSDIRWRIVWQRIGMCLSFRKISKNLNISVGTTVNILKLFERTGSVDPKKPRKRPEKSKLDNHHQLYIIGLILENPALYLKDICSKIREATYTDVSPSTICRMLLSHGFSRKKIQHIALQRLLSQRAAYMADISLFSRNMLVWVDETGCDKRDMLRRYGYSLRGQRAVCRRLIVRGKRVSAVAALSMNGILDFSVTTNKVDGEYFYDFVRGCLIPNMLPFDGTNSTSVVVMDNCSIHHVEEVKLLLEEAGILVVYLPPYSPDLNPIEEAFSSVKSFLKGHEDLLTCIALNELIKSAFSNITKEKCDGWISNCNCYNN